MPARPALQSDAGLGERRLRRFLEEMVENSSGADSDHDGRKTRNDKSAHSLLQFLWCCRSRWKREGLGFDVHENPTDRAHARVEVGRFGALQIGEEMSDPRRKILLKKRMIRFGG